MGIEIAKPPSGWIVIDKPLYKSSTRVGAYVRRKMGCKKLGHAGTLDPLASGVLPLALTEATKTMHYCMITDKEYTFSVSFGESRATDDLEGEVTNTTDHIPNYDDIVGGLPQFMGKITQIPPQYSALKINGKRACDLARDGVVVDMKSRVVDIYDLKCLEMDGNVAKFWVHCGVGTYVRSLARDMAAKLNSLGYVSALRRTRVGKFHESCAITLEKFDALVHNHDDFMLPVGYVLDDIPAYTVSDGEADDLRLGRSIVADSQKIGIVTVSTANRLVCIGEIIDGVLHPKRVFHL